MKANQDINMQSLESLSISPFLPDEKHMLNALIDRIIELLGDAELAVDWLCEQRNQDVRILFRLLQIEPMKLPRNQYYN